MFDSPIVILDNGAHSIKAGVVAPSGSNDSPPRIIPNQIMHSSNKKKKSMYIGAECSNAQAGGAGEVSPTLRLPFEKGFITDWDAQKAIWDGLFDKKVFNLNTTQSSIIVTEPYFNFPNIQEVYDQFVFEEYEFQRYWKGCAASLTQYTTLFDDSSPSPPPECTIIVDSGFSFTHVVPIMKGEVIWEAVRRLDIGGKLLTNQLKELVSYRQWNMMDETLIMNHVKEKCCFVSTDWSGDLEVWRKSPLDNIHTLHYVLPDPSNQRQGHIRPPLHNPTSGEEGDDGEQVLIMNNERFSIPEILFRPNDLLGLDQCGLPELIANSISSLPTDLQPMFWGNVGLIGGCTSIPGFKTRLFDELRMYAPTDVDVGVFQQENPITTPYYGAVSLVSRPGWEEKGSVTKEEYAEFGSGIWARKRGGGTTAMGKTRDRNRRDHSGPGDEDNGDEDEDDIGGEKNKDKRKGKEKEKVKISAATAIGGGRARKKSIPAATPAPPTAAPRKKRGRPPAADRDT